MEAKDLPAADINGKSDPYVFIKDVSGIHMKGKGAKTSVLKKNLNPKVSASLLLLLLLNTTHINLCCSGMRR